MRWLVLLALAAGCGGDASSCDQIRAHVSALLAQPQGCTTDSDCVYQQLNCGLPGDSCGDGIATSNAPALSSVVSQWYGSGCSISSGQCVMCPVALVASCVNHTCDATSSD